MHPHIHSNTPRSPERFFAIFHPLLLWHELHDLLCVYQCISGLFMVPSEVPTRQKYALHGWFIRGVPKSVSVSLAPKSGLPKIVHGVIGENVSRKFVPPRLTLFIDNNHPTQQTGRFFSVTRELLIEIPLRCVLSRRNFFCLRSRSSVGTKHAEHLTRGGKTFPRARGWKKGGEEPLLGHLKR